MPPLSEIVLATRNAGKVAELRALLSDLPLTLHAASGWAGAPKVVEDAPSLEGNARKKARALHRHTGLPALADDTGLEVEALGGRPGVHTARFAGPDADDAANRTALLAALDGQADRRAQFRTVAALASADGVHCLEGVCRGRIAEAEHGTGGFGYDALFIPEGYDQTFAELSPAEKNAISHRGRALEKMAAYLRARLGA